jgi:type IV secretion system protein TrbL
MRKQFRTVLALTAFCGLFVQKAAAGVGTDVIDNITNRYSSSAESWILSIQGHAENLFWILASIAAVWTFIVLVLRQSDLADFVGAVIRFILTTMFFYWLVDHGPTLAAKILSSTMQLAAAATNVQAVAIGDFIDLGIKIFIDVTNSVQASWNPIPAIAAILLTLIIMLALASITFVLILVNCQTYVLLSAGVIFLGFGATEWTRDLAVSYFKHLLGIGIKQFVLLLLASIALDILKTMDASHTSSGWTPDLADLCRATAEAIILLLLIAIVPGSVAGMCGVPVSTAGVGTLFAGAQYGAQAAALASGIGSTVMEGGRAMGSAVRNAVRRGQALSRGKP